MSHTPWSVAVIHIYSLMYVCVTLCGVCVFVCMCVCVCACVCRHIFMPYIHAHAHTCIHTHVSKHKLLPWHDNITQIAWNACTPACHNFHTNNTMHIHANWYVCNTVCPCIRHMCVHIHAFTCEAAVSSAGLFMHTVTHHKLK
jgi:hypothetical protein